MNRTASRTWLWLFASSILLTLTLTLPAQALAHGPSDGGANRGDINGLFTVIFWISVPVFILVEGLILYAIFRYRRRKAEELPEQIEGNHMLEWAWTILSFVIIAVVFVLTYRFMTTEYEAEAQAESGTPDVTVHVEGYMFNWDYEYFLGEGEATGVKTTRKITIPADKLVLLEITSRDVQHSFWLPDLAGKIDAIPGYTNTMWLKVDEPGYYKGNCAEFCGTLHWDMIIELTVLPPNEFDMWLADKQAEAGQFVPVGTTVEGELPAGDAERGESIFTELGCGACHGEQPGAGPSLAGMSERAQTRMEDHTTTEYLWSSIVNPCEYETEGYNCAIMPADYGEKLDAQSLADVIEYLLQH